MPSVTCREPMGWTDWITFDIAVAGFVLGGISLWWNITSWRRSGPDIVVDSMPPARWEEFSRTERVVYVRARNVGRGAVTVEDYGFLLDDVIAYREGNPPAGAPRPPVRLEGHDSVTFVMSERTLHHVVAPSVLPAMLLPFVKLGNGDRVVGSGGPIFYPKD